MDAKLEKQVEMDCFFEDEINELQRAEKEAERYIYVCKKKIEEYQQKLKNAEIRIKERKESTKNQIFNYLQNALNDGILQKESIRETKTRTTYTIPSANLIFKKEAEKMIVKDESSLIEYLDKNNKSEYIKTQQSINWAELKKTLKIVNGKIVDINGEILDINGIEIATTGEEFEIKYL